MPEKQPDTDPTEKENGAERAVPDESDEAGCGDANRADATTNDGYEPL